MDGSLHRPGQPGESINVPLRTGGSCPTLSTMGCCPGLTWTPVRCPCSSPQPSACFQRKRHFWRLDTKTLTLFQNESGAKFYRVREPPWPALVSALEPSRDRRESGLSRPTAAGNTPPDLTETFQALHNDSGGGRHLTQVGSGSPWFRSSGVSRRLSGSRWNASCDHGGTRAQHSCTSFLSSFCSSHPCIWRLAVTCGPSAQSSFEAEG